MVKTKIRRHSFARTGSSCAGQSSEKTISKQVQNLTAFSRVYGYVKYFHPSDEAREINWDKLAVMGAERVKKASTLIELKEALEALFLPIAPTISLLQPSLTVTHFSQHM